MKLDLQPVQAQELLADVVEIVKAKAESDRIRIVENYHALRSSHGCGIMKAASSTCDQCLPGHAGRRDTDDRRETSVTAGSC